MSDCSLNAILDDLKNKNGKYTGFGYLAHGQPKFWQQITAPCLSDSINKILGSSTAGLDGTGAALSITINWFLLIAILEGFFILYLLSKG